MSDITRDFSFGGIIRDLRIERKLTLREAAKRLGMDPGNLSKLERSELDPPRRAGRIKELCRKLGFPKAEPLLKSLAYQHYVAALKKEFES